MLTCAEYRRNLLADPQHRSSEMLGHVGSCHDCAEYTAGVMRFEQRLLQALQVKVEPMPSAKVVPFRSRARVDRASRLRRRGFAVAASVLLATLGAASLWLGAPGRSLAAAVVDHMAEEPQAWTRTSVAVAGPRLDDVMGDSNLHLKPGAGLVSYANSCEFRGHRVPHLVVQTDTGPVTVMVLSHESVRHGVHFDEQGYRGMIVPVPNHGSVAVLEQSTSADSKGMEAVAARVLAAVEWSK